MKKIISVFVIVLVFGLSACSVIKQADCKNEIALRLESASVYPYYSSLSEADKEIYADICAAIESHTTLSVGHYTDYKKAEEEGKKISKMFENLIYEQPQYFWIDPYGVKCTVSSLLGYNLTASFPSLMDEDEIGKAKEELEERVDKIISSAKEKKDTYSTVLCVYDEILKGAEYDYILAEQIDKANNDKNSGLLSEINQTAYGCLVSGETVCSGYTLAFNLVMQRLGYECGAVPNEDLSEGSSTHVSNYCKLDGDYYYFDLTWDDTGYDAEEYKQYMDFSHQYFAITKAEFEKNHKIYDDFNAPNATENEYNYFVQNKMYFEEYNYGAVKASVVSQLESGYASLKFETEEELSKAVDDLITNEKIYDLIGKDRCSYSVPTGTASLYIFF